MVKIENFYVTLQSACASTIKVVGKDALATI